MFDIKFVEKNVFLCRRQCENLERNTKLIFVEDAWHFYLNFCKSLTENKQTKVKTENISGLQLWCVIFDAFPLELA